jgi:4-amino-4-deoxy-L-arabinose transferase-like glycosyltransferase
MDLIVLLLSFLPEWLRTPVLILGYLLLLLLSLWLTYTIVWRGVRRGIREYVIQRDRKDPMALPTQPLN